MRADATAALPGMGSVAEAAIERCRALFRAPAETIDRGALLWNLLNADERRFVLRVARVEVTRAAASWRELTELERDAVTVGWRRLADWVSRIERHFQRVTP